MRRGKDAKPRLLEWFVTHPRFGYLVRARNACSKHVHFNEAHSSDFGRLEATLVYEASTSLTGTSFIHIAPASMVPCRSLAVVGPQRYDQDVGSYHSRDMVATMERSLRDSLMRLTKSGLLHC